MTATTLLDVTATVPLSGVVSGAFILLIAIISYFIKKTLARLDGIETAQNGIQQRLATNEEDLQAKANRMDRIEAQQEAGYAEITGIVQQLLEPIKVELSFIHSAVEEIKNGKK